MVATDRADTLFFIEAFQRILVLHDFQGAHQSNHASIADQRVIQQSLPFLLQVGTDVVPDAGYEVFVLNQFQICDCDGASCRVAGIRVTVEKLAAFVDQYVGDAITHEYATQWQVSRCHAFREWHEIRAGPKVIRAKPFAQTPESGNNFIGNQQNSVLITDSLHFGPVGVCRHNNAARSLNRLADKCGDLVGADLFDLVFNRTSCGNTKLVW